MSIVKLRITGRISFWAAGLMGAASGVLGVIGLALPSGICGALGAVAGMIGGAAANRMAKLELEAVRGEAIAFAVAL